MTISSNAPEVVSQLNDIAAKVGDPVPGLERMRQVLSEQEAQVWTSQGATLGTSWPPSADPARKTDSRLLVATGALRSSLTGGGAGEVVGHTLQFGTDVPYGGYHQYGTGRMPARPFLGVAPETASRLREYLEQTMGENLR